MTVFSDRTLCVPDAPGVRGSGIDDWLAYVMAVIAPTRTQHGTHASTGLSAWCWCACRACCARVERFVVIERSR
jgi:hypothetical protein